MEGPRTLLLHLSERGEPVTASAYGQGVLTLPSLPPPNKVDDKNPFYTVRLSIAAGSPACREGLVWTNVPSNYETPFQRNEFRKLSIHANFHQDAHVELRVFRPGTYCFYLSFRNEQEQLETTKKFYFVVLPTLNIQGKFVPPNSIAMQSVISKWMGKDLNQWNNVFARIAEKGYNMVHFTPLQRRGESNSPYSIYDQLEFDPTVFKNTEEVTQMVIDMESKHRLLALTDVVFNHTANNSQWLLEHPDAGYNHETAPHLIAAMELDKGLLQFSANLAKYGLPEELQTLDDLTKIMDGIKTHVLEALKLWEFYVVDIEETLSQLQKYTETADSSLVDIPEGLISGKEIRKLALWVKDNAVEPNFGKLGTRSSNKVNVPKFKALLRKLADSDSTQEQEWATKVLNELNLPLYQEYDDDSSAIMNQLYNRIKYLRIDGHGPKQGKITKSLPLTEPYFTRFTGKNGIDYALANNGWIWNGNPLVDFASDQSKAYLRREVIVWGDCVKLRYGAKPEDSPYLWNRMTEYVEMNAKIFSGFRIDNCHSTPLHVGEYFLDVARRVNPNLYVVAELFSGSEQMDCLFVERLGISSLVREAMQAWSEEELSRLVHRHGGRPIGSYRFVPMDNFPYPADVRIDNEYCAWNDQDNAVKCVSEIMIPQVLTATPPHALFMDCTHDNETPFQKRTVEDTLPNAALVSLCSSAIGSVYGYDEIYPYLLDLVGESRTYECKDVSGIGKVKSLLNSIRAEIASTAVGIEDSEMHVHHDGQYITFHRTDVKSGKGWYLVSRMKFHNNDPHQEFPPIELSQTAAKLKFAYNLEKVGDVPQDNELLKGIPTNLRKLSGFEVSYDDKTHNTTILLPKDFPQGSIAIFETQFNGLDASLDHFIRSGAIRATDELTLDSINSVLYRAEGEEYDINGGSSGAYDIPDYGKPVYCGLQGFVSILRSIVFNNDLAHPLSNNLRAGNWALDYTVNRLDAYKNEPGIKLVQEWLRSRFDRIKQLPGFLVPSYFALCVGIMYGTCRLKSMQLMTNNIGKSTVFVQSLAMTSVQMVSKMKSASILPDQNVPALAAGLPHFSTGYMRCWGRDVFISLRGLLLTTGRFKDAEAHILAFAKTLKHGLIPNLLDSGRNPRYNARDAAWFFFQSIQDYVEIVPGGLEILKKKVTRRFPLDDRYIAVDDKEAFSYSSTLEDIMYEILNRHAKGISYREANAGPNLDRVMKDEGFNVEVYVDWSTGFIHGGSQFNCGTWMDKMGESDKAGSTGIPGTPRDGAAVEINGLLKSALRFVNSLNKEGHFKYTDVEKQDGSRIALTDWESLLQENFERKFYIPSLQDEDKDYDIDSAIVNRRGIYKDLFKSGKPYEDYQLRPNFAIAMTVAPELFNPEHAVKAIRIADEVIRGPLGMRTLDPSDYNYRPDYINSVDSDDFATSKGRNYHQGPEWVWCYGYFLRAFHYFNFLTKEHCKTEHDGKMKPSQYLYQELFRRMAMHRKWIAESPWAGLTELTNKDGKMCDDSSPTQAWSSGCLLDLFYDLWQSYSEDD